MLMTLSAALAVLFLASFVLSPRVRTADGFFRGVSAAGEPPGLLTLVLSQVTTWIFARSLLNAAILGYYYGLAGTLAYAAYYLSFLTGARIVDAIRFRHGRSSVQDFLRDRFGRFGVGAYNSVVSIRLMSEVFANLLVVGIIFGLEGTLAYILAIIAIGLVTLVYSMLGGLSASLRTDVLQSSVLIGVLAVLLVQAVGLEGFRLTDLAATSPDIDGPGWVLLLVALLQIWSYPLHDPVMMDRGFLADRATTRSSFLHACWISLVCIVAFGLLGVFAGMQKLEGEDLIASLTRLLGDPAMTLFNMALVISAVSTLDSTYSSAAKLSIVDMGLARPTAANGRWAMAVSMLGGLTFLFLGSKDLFAAVAVSGTASMFLAPVIFFCIWGGCDVARWAFAVAFIAAITGAALYFLEAGGHADLIEPLTGIAHKYSKLLLISAAVLAIGCGAFILGLKRREAA
jgi:Na+/proline symporter